MNSDDSIPDAIKDLIDQAINGTITEDGLKRLDAALLDNSAAQRFFLEYCQFQIDLLVDGRADRAIDDFHRNQQQVAALLESFPPLPKQGLARQSSLESLGRRMVRKLSGIDLKAAVMHAAPVCLLLVLAGMVGGYLALRFASAPQRLEGDTANSPVAYLTSTNGCHWSDGLVPAVRQVGSAVDVGDELTLHEGIAEFRLASGVSLSIEGPASLLLISPSSLVLQYGKLTAYVPWGSADFKAVAAGCRFVTRDAEFGLQCMDNKLDIHVFSGDVSAGSPMVAARLETDGELGDVQSDEDKDYFTDAVITAGRSLQLTAQGNVLKVAGWNAAQPASFATKLSMSGPLPITPEYVEQVRASRPIAYWRFEEVADSMIASEVKSAGPLVAHGKILLVGDRNNQSAELRWDGDWYLKSKKKLPLANTEYSIEAWVKPSHVHSGTIAYLHYKADSYDSGARLELQGSGINRGAVRYVQRTFKEKPDFGTSCFSTTPYAARRWQHVVAVKSGSQMKFYLDGKLCATGEEDAQLSHDVVAYVGVHRDRKRNKYIGQLDELAIYNRPLTESEILQHYQAVHQVTVGADLEETSNRLSTLPKEI